MNTSEPTDVQASLELAARLKWLASYSDVEPSKALVYAEAARAIEGLVHLLLDKDTPHD